jgi:DNA processing protein
LANRLVRTEVKPLGASEMWSLLDRVPDPAVLLGASVDRITELSGWHVDQASRLAVLLDSGTSLAFELEQLEQLGIAVVTPFDAGYPLRLRERLQGAAPPLLFVAGRVELLADDGVAIVGSRSVDVAGAEIAKTVAATAARSGRTVISGGARGVDQLAMAAAFSSGGAVVGVVAEAMSRVLRVGDTLQAVLGGKACVCSPFKPDTGFTAGNAMARNKIIYGLARVAFVVASDLDRGGTWSGATEAIRRNYTPVAVWRGQGEGPGNAALEGHGATPVGSLDELFHVTPVSQRVPKPEQLGFNLLGQR